MKTKEKPPVVCICGSTRFKKEMMTLAEELTMRGKIVLMPNVFAHADGIKLTDTEKLHLDVLHFFKIDMSDEVAIVNPGGYIGESTNREIAYAQLQKKEIVYWDAQRG
jgi:hypothetical protein